MINISLAIFNLLGGKGIENKLHRCQSYRTGSILRWKEQTGLTIFEVIKTLNAIDIFDAQRIRLIIDKIVNDNIDVFNKPNLFITAFGSQGKSGGQIAYEFKHTHSTAKKQYINGWELSKLPEQSTIIFVEDLIGTGSQSTEYILEKLNLLLNPSHNPILLTICGTPEGIDKVKNETNFDVITGVLLTEDKYQYYSNKNTYFNSNEKEKLKKINLQLKKKGKDYDKGLLIAFYYSPPNNSMPILWKDNFRFHDKKGNEKKWFALIPREY